MVRASPLFTRVVALGGALLVAVAVDDGGVHVQGEPVDAQALKQPAVDLPLHLLVPGHVKAVEQALDRFVSGHPRPAKQAAQCAIHAGDVGMREAVGIAPDADQKLLDDLQRLVVPVGAGLR